MTIRAKAGHDNEGQVVFFRCPGCLDNHMISVGTWTWNGSEELPTFTPSLLVRGNQWPKEDFPEFYKNAHPEVPPGADTVCHSFVTDGKIQFLNDSTHSLAGKTVDLPEWKHA